MCLVHFCIPNIMDESCSSQPSYLCLLLDETDPDEIWDCPFTSSQLVKCVPSPDYCHEVHFEDTSQVTILDPDNVQSLWTKDFTDTELHQAVDSAVEETPNFNLDCPIIISSDEGEPSEKKPKTASCEPPLKKPAKKFDPPPPPAIGQAKHMKQQPFKQPMSKEMSQQMKFKAFAPKMKRKVNWVMTMYSQWHALRQQDCPDLEKCVNLDKSSVQEVLCAFITEVHKLDGSNFPPRTLYEILFCLQMGLESHGIHWKFLEDMEFVELKYTLDNEMKKCTREGIAHPVKQADVISPEQEEILWCTGILGKEKPLQLMRTVLFLLGINLALHAGQEHCALRSIGYDSQLSFAVRNGQRIVIYREDPGTKMNQGGLRHKKVPGKTVTIYPHPNRDRCPVAALLKYHARLPPKRKSDALYLWPKCDSKAKDSVWYYDIPVGINKLQSVVKEMCQEAGFQGNYSNHSLRSTSATRMYEAGIDEQIICKITGHRSNAVRAYKRTSEELKHKASATISCAAKSTHETTVWQLKAMKWSCLVCREKCM